MKKILNKGDTIGIVACSNGISKENIDIINELRNTLKNIELNVKLGDVLYRKDSIFNGTGEERAYELNKMFLDKNIKAIFDISGGDLANGILDYIDYEAIKNNPKPFFGYSDLSVVLNSIYTMTGVSTYHYQIRNIIGNFKEVQLNDFEESFINGKENIGDLKYHFVQGDSIKGEVVGGNIRCFLKLAGTQYMPNFENKILFLEALSGDVGKIYTYLNQLKQLGAFNKVNGILLGTFTEMEKNQYKPTVEELLIEIINNKDIPIIKTRNLGHGSDGKCIVIGEKISFNI